MQDSASEKHRISILNTETGTATRGHVSQRPPARFSDLMYERSYRTETAQYTFPRGSSQSPTQSTKEVMEMSRERKKDIRQTRSHFLPIVNFSFPFRRVIRYKREEKFNGRTSGSGSGHRDHRTSLARHGGCRQPGVCGRTEREPA